MGFAAPFGQDQALGSGTGRKAASSDGLTSIEHTVTVAVKAGVAQDLAHIGLTVVVAIFLALVGNVIAIAILGTIGQITLVGNTVEVAVGKAFTFIRNGVRIAVGTGAIVEITLIKDTVVVAILLAFIRHSVVVTISAGSTQDVALVKNAIAIAIWESLTVVGDAIVVAVDLTSIRNAVAVTIWLAIIGDAIGITIVVFEFTSVRYTTAVAIFKRFASVRDTVAVAVRQGLAVIRNAVVVAVDFAIIRNAVVVTIGLTGIRDAIVVAIWLTFIGDTVGVAVCTGSIADITSIRDAVGIAIIKPRTWIVRAIATHQEGSAGRSILFGSRYIQAKCTGIGIGAIQAAPPLDLAIGRFA